MKIIVSVIALAIAGCHARVGELIMRDIDNTLEIGGRK